jgi:hypothetical protein
MVWKFVAMMTCAPAPASLAQFGAETRPGRFWKAVGAHVRSWSVSGTLTLLTAGGLVLGYVGFSSVPLWAQTVGSAQIGGTVADPTGAAVAGAEVTATQTETNAVHRAVTGATGAYVFPNLPVGPYSLKVTAGGFAVYVQTGILLSVGNNITINIALTIGPTQQQVEVSANVGMVETRDTATSQVIDQQRVLDLPLNGRQASALILLSGGAVDASAMGTDLVSTKNYGSADISATSAISVAGGQASATNYMMDGGDNNEGFSSVNLPFPFPDAIQEFSVQTSGLSARYGVHAGGTVNIITKSGTNQYHGELFEFLRNGDVNARNFFAATHDTLRRNQFGGTIGGPVKKDHLFFFFGYQGTRIRTAPPSLISYVPTAAVLNGDFSQLEGAGCQSNGKAKTITNPSTGAPFPGAQVPVSLFNPQAMAILKYVPTSANPCGTITYAIPSAEGENQYIGRVDWVKTEKQTLFARYFRTNLDNPPPPFLGDALNTQTPGLLDQSQSAIVGDTYSFSATALNSLRLTFSRAVINRRGAPDAIGPNTVGIDVSEAAPNFLQVSVNNYFNIGCGSCALIHTAHTYMNAAEDFDLIRGRHHITFGGSWLHEESNGPNLYAANGQWTFNGTFSGDSLLDFMLGSPITFMQGNPAVLAVRQQYVGAYAQDDFQVNRRLIVHFGLRWEPFLASTDMYNREYTFDPQAFAAGKKSQVFVNAPPGLSFIGDPGVSKGYRPRKLTDFDPRVGLAWDVNGNGRQTIRASYGIFYELPSLFYAGSRMMQSAPWGTTVTLTAPPNGLSNPFGGPDPFPSAAPSSTVAFPAQGTYISVPQSIRPTYQQSWSLSYQRELSANWMVSVTYMGNKLTHQWGATEEDPAVYIPGTCSAGQYGLTAAGPCSTTANTAHRRVLSLLNPIAGNSYSTITLADDGANSSYNGLLASIRHRFNSHYTLLTNYTYSHCIGEGMAVGDLSAAQYQDPYNRDGDRANCRYDIRQNANISMVAQMPHFADPWRQRLLSNWQLAPLISLRTGLWFSPVTGVDNSLTGVGLDRPNVVGDPYNRNLGTLQWLNPAAFVANPVGTFGDAGNDSLQGPGYFDVDVAFSRSFQVRESHRLDVRFEAFNALNHTNFSTPTATLTSAQFGRISAAAAPRVLQFAMKYSF